jgi:hypothetical protein
MKRLRSKLTYANVVATLALFLVIAGGSAFAASKFAKNSVGTKQIKNNAVTGAKIKNGAVTGAKINLSSLGTVPSAASAQSANHADTANTATSAGTAGTAGNAQTLGGKSAEQITAQSKLSCPQGMKLDSGLCFEPSPRAATSLASAIFACSEIGRWLPSVGQLLAYERKNYSSSPPSEWTESITYNGAVEYGFTASGAVSISSLGPTEATSSHPFRCITAPAN